MELISTMPLHILSVMTTSHPRPKAGGTVNHQDFERRRQQAFIQHAHKFLQRCDPQDGLIHSVKYKGQDVSIHTRAAGYDIRALAEAACVWSCTGHQEKAWQALELVLDNQDRNPDSLTFGNFKWYSEWPMALDPNAAAFIIPHIWHLCRHAGDNLPPALRDRLRLALRDTYDGIQAHCCTFLYTNIILLNMAAQLCIADLLEWERPRLVVGWAFEEWRNRIAHLGVMPEYNSLTYTAVDIHALAIMLACPAQPGLHQELRALMRLFISQAIADYHPGIGRITGAQSRAYPADRRLCGQSCMDTILDFVLPESGVARTNLFPWLGVPIGPEDILPEVRHLPLPRTVRAAGAGQTRQNHLGENFALASISGRGHWTGHALPFFLAFRSPHPRCAIPILPHAHPHVELHAADQQQGSLAAGCCWLKQRRARELPPARNFSGLNTGTPDNLQTVDFTPGFTLELGHSAEAPELTGIHGKALSPGKIRGTVIVISMGDIRAGFRFYAPGCTPELRLQAEDDGELVLTVDAAALPLPLSPLEEATAAAFVLEVVAQNKLTAAELADLLQALPGEMQATPNGWQLTAPSLAGPLLHLDMDARPACFWDIPGSRLNSNLWVEKLRQNDPENDNA